MQSDRRPKPLADFLENWRGDLWIETGLAISADRNVLEEALRRSDRQFYNFTDVPPCKRYRERFGFEPASPAGGARPRLHVLLELEPYRVGLRLVVAALDVGDDSFPARPGFIDALSALAGGTI